MTHNFGALLFRQECYKFQLAQNKQLPELLHLFYHLKFFYKKYESHNSHFIALHIKVNIEQNVFK